MGWVSERTPGPTAPTAPLTQQQEAEHPLEHGEELQPGTDIPLRGPRHGQQCAQGGMEAGTAACGDADTVDSAFPSTEPTPR